MTTTSIIDRVRRLVQDGEAPYHWSDSKIHADIQCAIRALHKVRPETRYVDGLLVDEVVLPVSTSDVIGIDDRFEDCIAYYSAYMTYSDDCTDPVSKKLSDDFLGKFNMLAQL